MDDDDYEDLLGEDDDQDVRIQEEVALQPFGVGGTESQDPMVDSSSAAIIPDMPSANELRLGQKVADLEAERAQLLIQELRGREVTSPTIPVPPPSTDPLASRQILIPHDLLPTLQLLRTHIGELTRDNDALRYTFIGRSLEATSSKVTLDQPTTAAGGAVEQAIPGGVHGVDLGRVVERVRELLRENEELGEMVLEAGRTDAGEYEKTLNDSRKIIETLESDLEHHAATVQSLRSQIVAYRTHFGPIPSSKDPRPGGGTPDQGGARVDSPRDRDRDRPRDNRDRQAGQSGQRPPRESIGAGQPGPQEHGLSIRGMSNQPRQSMGGGEKRDERRPGQGGQRGDDRRDERGGGAGGGGGRRREDDRGSKRRR